MHVKRDRFPVDTLDLPKWHRPAATAASWLVKAGLRSAKSFS